MNQSIPRVRFCWWCGRKLYGRHHVDVEVDGLPRVMHVQCNKNRAKGYDPPATECEIADYYSELWAEYNIGR